jgi:hypothetical protein
MSNAKRRVSRGGTEKTSTLEEQDLLEQLINSK